MVRRPRCLPHNPEPATPRPYQHHRGPSSSCKHQHRSQSLVDELPATWATIGGMRKCFDLIATRLQGNLDTRFYSA
jgi:hypothetical protein